MGSMKGGSYVLHIEDEFQEDIWGMAVSANTNAGYPYFLGDIGAYDDDNNGWLQRCPR